MTYRSFTNPSLPQIEKERNSYYDICMAETIRGKEVSQADIDAWVEEAEAGYDVPTLIKRGRGRPGRGAQPSQVVAVRFTPEEIAELDARAHDQHLTRSAFIREKALA